MENESRGLFAFVRKYPDEMSCIEALANLRWSSGFSCQKCQHVKAHHLKARPRVYECASCGHQHSVTAGTVFHKTKIDLTKWFVAAYMLASDKRGVSASHISRELGLRYASAWFMLHRLRAALFEREGFELESFVEADEAFYGGYGEKGQPGRSMNPKKSMVMLAIERRPSPKGRGWRAGSMRVEVIKTNSTAILTGFMLRNVKPKTEIATDGSTSYLNLADAGFKHSGKVASGRAAGVHLPLVHIMFSNMKAWLNGTHHGVSKSISTGIFGSGITASIAATDLLRISSSPVWQPDPERHIVPSSLKTGKIAYGERIQD